MGIFSVWSFVFCLFVNLILNVFVAGFRNFVALVYFSELTATFIFSVENFIKIFNNT